MFAVKTCPSYGNYSVLAPALLSYNNIMMHCTVSQVYAVVDKCCVKLKKGKESCERTNRYHQLLKEKEDLKIKLSKVGSVRLVSVCSHAVKPLSKGHLGTSSFCPP